VDVAGPISKVTLTGAWHDQGWGNRYGRLSFVLKRGNTSVCSFASELGNAPHTETSIHKNYSGGCLANAQKGDILDLMVRPGRAGSGFRLFLSNIKVQVKTVTCACEQKQFTLGALRSASFTNFAGWGATKWVSEAVNGPVTSMTLSGQWKDQGWGNH